MSEDLWKNYPDDDDKTAERMEFLVPFLARAKWIVGDNVVMPKIFSLQFTVLGQQRLHELFLIQQAFDPLFFGRERSNNDAPKLAAARAALATILVELGAKDFTLPQLQFLMAFVRLAAKDFFPQENLPQLPPSRS